jgi:hypothetical protein
LEFINEEDIKYIKALEEEGQEEVVNNHIF